MEEKIFFDVHLHAFNLSHPPVSGGGSSSVHGEVRMEKRTFFDDHLQAFSFRGYGKVLFPK